MTKKLIMKNVMIMFAKKRQVKAYSQGPLMGHQLEKGSMYLHQRIEKKSLIERKVTMNTKQAARDDAFLKIMGALVQQSHAVVTSPGIPPVSEPHNQFRYAMTNVRPKSSVVCLIKEISHKI